MSIDLTSVEAARRVLIGRIDGIIGDLRSANDELRGQRGIAAAEQVRKVSATISEYQSLRTRISNLR